MKAGVVVFPGSNCDRDAFWAIKKPLGEEVEFIWHKDSDLSMFDLVILPGGFSYGDYLRTGAIAKFSPVMSAVKNFSEKGGLVLGICNGFQILLECGLLPGAMIPNEHLRFICKDVHLRVERNDTPFTNSMKVGQILRIPIAHFEGNYYADDATIERIEKKGSVIFRYCDENGEVSERTNPNGSRNNIAGLMNESGNILGMMPHPERASEKLLGSVDGLRIFESILSYCKTRLHSE